MKTHQEIRALVPYPMTPPDDPPEPCLDAALPCVCGVAPEWEQQYGKTRLFCFRHCVEGDYEADSDRAVTAWNQAVAEEGESRKAAGQELVKKHNGAWMYSVLAVIKAYTSRGLRFTVQDIRGDCIIAGLPQPKSPNAWGAAFSVAAKQGLIVRVGYQKNRLSSAHSRIVSTWKGVSS